MAGTTLSTADSALKEFYEPGLRKQLNDDIPLLAQYEKNTSDVEGRRAVLSLHVSRNSGVGARGELGTLPTAGAQGYAEERIPLKYNYGRIQLSGPVIRAMGSDRGSFVRAVESETSRVRDDLMVDVGRQVWGTTDGKIATCTTTTSSATVNLATATTVVQMREFEVGMKVDIGTVAAPTTVVAAAVISAVDATNKTITIDSSVTTSSSHFIFRAGSVGASVNYELTGLQTIVKASGTLFNVNPTTYPVWASYVDSNSGTNRALSENLMASVVQNIQIAGGKFPALAIASDGVHRAYANLLTTLKRFPQTVNLKGGYAGLDFTAGGPTIPVVWDRFCPNNSMFFVNPENLIEFQSSDWEFMQQDGAVLSRVANLDAYEATLFKYHETATDKRNAHGLLTDVTTA